MSKIALPRSVGSTVSPLRDPALLVPAVAVGVLLYLAVFPLFTLLLGSFQVEVAPRGFVLTPKNYQAAYASQYTIPRSKTQ